jgi:hypothetical protein
VVLNHIILINCFKLKTASDILGLKKLINISNIGGFNMSRRNEAMCCNRGGLLGGAFSGNILNLIIFVLIVLQFGTKKDEECEEHDHEGIDNSILFIIALFFLFVCSCGSNGDCC